MTDFGFTLDTLKELNRRTSGDIVFKVKKTTVSSAKAKAAVGTRPAYDISLWGSQNGKETRLTNLNGKTISVAVPYRRQRTSRAAICMRFLWILRARCSGSPNPAMMPTRRRSLSR